MCLCPNYTLAPKDKAQPRTKPPPTQKKVCASPGGGGGGMQVKWEWNSHPCMECAICLCLLSCTTAMLMD